MLRDNQADNTAQEQELRHAASQIEEIELGVSRRSDLSWGELCPSYNRIS